MEKNSGTGVLAPSSPAPVWFRALDLVERLRLRAPLSEVQGDETDRAKRRLDRWCSQSSFASNEAFRRRLARDRLTPEDLERLLGESPGSLRQRSGTVPPWLSLLHAAYAAPATDVCLPPGSSPGRSLSVFLRGLRPLLSWTWKTFLQSAEILADELPDNRWDPEAIGTLLWHGLIRRLRQAIGRTFVLELQVARIDGRLHGSTPEERHASFVASLEDPVASLAILSDYPVLARQLMLHCQQWREASLKLVTHLSKDWAEIRRTFSLDGEQGPVTEISSSLGDFHREGRTVLLLTFASGFRLVYKPRSLSVDARFQELLSWVNTHGFEPCFRLLRVLDRGDHGWQEFISPQGCSRREEISRFYERQGGNLALLYVLHGTDFHFENLIAAGEDPVLVDLETLFHPRSGTWGPRGRSAIDQAPWDDSILGTGLLPQRLEARGEHGGVDLSGLGGAPGQQLTGQVLQVRASGTDSMHLVAGQQELAGAMNRPSYRGEEIEIASYGEALERGFARLYRLLVRHREELLAPRGPLTRFADSEVRVIPRPTAHYGSLLAASLHPYLLRDALDRERLFDHLWGATEELESLGLLVASERRQLHRGDTPVFTTRPGSRDLHGGDGTVLSDFLPETGTAEVCRRLQRLDDDDQARQTWIIKQSLRLRSADQGRTGKGWHDVAPSTDIPPPGRFLKAAANVGERLKRLAFRRGREAVWLHPRAVDERTSTLLPTGPELASGLPGIALFLAHLGQMTDDREATDLARAAVRALETRLEKGFPEPPEIGAFSGAGGVLYCLSQLASLWRDESFLALANRLVSPLAGPIQADRRLDVMAGAAGCLLGLLRLHALCPSDRTLELAVLCGERLLETAENTGGGFGWVPERVHSVPLTGLSHGAAGISWALAELAAVSGEERFREAALGGLRYERSLYLPLAKNWPDLRSRGSEDGSTRYACAWCHGAPGIGLARLASQKFLDDAEIEAEIDVAIETTQRQGLGQSHCLCHGDLGNLDFLFEVGTSRDDRNLVRTTLKLAGGVVDGIERKGPKCGVPAGIEPPGLLLGLAGIGYQLLRFSCPDRVPSVLRLEPFPVTSRRLVPRDP